MSDKPFHNEASFSQQLAKRHRLGQAGRITFFVSSTIGIILLIVLFGHILNQNFGYVVIRNSVPPSELADQPLTELDPQQLANILVDQLGPRLRVILRDELSQVPNDQFVDSPLSEVLEGREYPDEVADSTINDLSLSQIGDILAMNMSQNQLENQVTRRVVEPRVAESWNFIESILNRQQIQQQAEEEYPDDTLRMISWLDWDFIIDPPTSVASTTGLSRALLGSLWVMLITAVSSLVFGVGAALYLEEYAQQNWFNRAIELNIRNLAAIPSVIYGMLGLAVFVYFLQRITSGQIFGIDNPNGRTILSAGLTLGLLILPIIVVNAQEAIRAVPNSIRQASYGLGATKLQTVTQQVLPTAMPGIMTGVILALSRAVGETAPLLVVGAATFLTADPTGIFSRFTVVPIRIFQWTAEPAQEFKFVAAAASIVLLIVMLLLNTTAIILRNYFERVTRT